MRTLCTVTCRSLPLIAAFCLFAISASAAEPEAKTTPPPAAAQLQGPVARVNGTEIPVVELKRAQKVILANQPGRQLSADEQKELNLRVADQLVSAELLYQSAKKLEIKDLDQQVDARIAQGKARFASEADFAKAIQELDMTEKDLREYTRRDLIIANFVASTIVPKVAVSEEESKKFYDQNMDKFRQEEKVRASHILCGIDTKASAEEKKKAREKAEKLRKELAGGADFATLARENSSCPSSKQGGTWASSAGARWCRRSSRPRSPSRRVR
nr:SurA N-terminal domain-containing protein [Geobacter sp. FeAm09]